MLSLEFKAIPPPPLSFLLPLNINIVLDCMELLFPAIAATTPTAPALYACRDIEFRKETRVKRGVHLKLERKGSLGFTGS
jgi:hypothetical protein